MYRLYFTTNQIIEKHRECTLPALIAFLDYEKAFDKVIRAKSSASYD
jgi:hypothetical protein